MMRGILVFFSLFCVSLSLKLVPRRFRFRILNQNDDNIALDEEYEVMRRQIESMIQPDIVPDPSAAVSSAVSIEPTSPKVNTIVAAASSFLGAFLFLFLHNQPASGLALMKAMSKESPALSEVLCNGKPTIVDFYAEWCESCKAMAPAMRALELKYKSSINFVTIDGSDYKNSELVGKFRVDGIPHVAFIAPNAEVKTALVGAVPQAVLDEDIKALLKDNVLPYEGYDAFDEESHFPLKSEFNTCLLQ